MNTPEFRDIELQIREEKLLRIKWDEQRKRSLPSATAWSNLARPLVNSGKVALAMMREAPRSFRVQQKLEELEQLVIDARFECTGPGACLTTTEYADTLTKMLGIIRSIDEANED